MTIETELLTLDATKTAIAAAIEGQGRDLTGKTFGEYAPEIVAIQSCTVSDLEAAWTDSAAVVNGRLVADTQDPYDRVDPVQPRVVEAGDGAGIYRDTVPLQATGTIIIKLIGGPITGSVSTPKVCGVYTSDQSRFVFLYLGNGNNYRILFGDAAISFSLDETAHTVEIDYTATDISLTVDNILVSQQALSFTPSNSPVSLYGKTSAAGHDSFSNVRLISYEVVGVCKYSAANMYYDQIGNNHAAAYGGTPIVTAHTYGDHSLDERGYTDDNGTIIPASLTDPTKDAAGNPLEFAGRNAHSANIQGYAALCSDSTYTATDPVFISNSAYTLHVRVRLDDISGVDHGLISIGVIPDPSQGSVYTREMNSLRISNDGKIRHLWWYYDVNTDIGTVSADGKYHDIIATYDGVTRYVYLDGVSVGSHVPTESLAVNSGVINVGSERDILYAKNPISIASYYSRALTQAEVSDISANNIIPSSGLICFYDGYNLSKDLSGNNLDLSVVGNPTDVTDTDGSMRIYDGYHKDGSDIFPLLADGSACTDGSPPDANPNIIADLNPVMSMTQDSRLEQYVGGSGMDLGAEFDYDGITETDKVIKFDINGLAVFSTVPSVPSILKAIL